MKSDCVTPFSISSNTDPLLFKGKLQIQGVAISRHLPNDDEFGHTAQRTECG